MRRDPIFRMSKGEFPCTGRRYECRGKKKGRDPKVSAIRFDCLENEKVQLGSALLLKAFSAGEPEKALLAFSHKGLG